MKFLKLFSLVFLFAGLAACNPESHDHDHDHDSGEHSHDHSHEDADHSHDEGDDSHDDGDHSQEEFDFSDLSLNDGAKWLVNGDTQVGMMEMREIMDQFSDSGSSEYSKLGSDLQAQTDLIIKKCDMEGEAHEQLHLVLIPMLGEIDMLKNAQDAEKGKVHYEKMDELLGLYFEHFDFAG